MQNCSLMESWDPFCKLIWGEFSAILKDNIKADFGPDIDLLKELGLSVNDGVITWESEEIATGAHEWVMQNLKGYNGDKRTNLQMSISKQMIVCNVIHASQQRIQPGSISDTCQEFLIFNMNNEVKHMTDVKDKCQLSRMYMVMEMKSEVKKRKVQEVRTETVKKSRQCTNGHESKNETLLRLRNIYAFAHRDTHEVYTSIDHKENICYLPTSLYDALGDHNQMESITDITKLDKWVSELKRVTLAITLRNLFLDSDERLYLYQVDSNPCNSNEIDPELRAELERRRVNDPNVMPDVAFSILKDRQIKSNVIRIARTLRWFAGKGNCPKFRAQFYNWQTDKTTSGKAAPPWYLIMKTFELDYGAVKAGQPSRTPIAISHDMRDPDTEEFLLAFESNPLHVRDANVSECHIY